MPYSGTPPNLVYQRTDGFRTGVAVCQQAQAASVNNTSALCDAREQDLADAINSLLLRDGGNKPTADIDWNGLKITNLGVGAARTESIRLGQVQDGAVVYAEASGSANAIALSTNPTTGPVEGIVIGFVAEAQNSGATTINLNGNGAVALQIAGAALTGGEIRNLGFYKVGYDGTNWQLLNGSLPSIIANLGTVSNVAIAGGTINGTIIGGSTPAAITGTAIVGTSLFVGTGGVTTTGTIEIGHTSDTTLSRSSAGNVAVEGNLIYRAGGTDVPVADGGTGASTAAGARTNLGGILSDAVFPGALVVIAEDQKSSGTDGGSFAASTDVTRTLNTLVYSRNLVASLSSNQVTLPAGIWEIEWAAPGSQCGFHQSWLYNVTDSTVVAWGSSSLASTGDVVTTPSVGHIVVTIAGSKAFEIRHRCSGGKVTTGLGAAVSLSGSNECYARLAVRVG